MGALLVFLWLPPRLLIFGRNGARQTCILGPHTQEAVLEPRISIITLGVADLERSYRFYHQGLGFPTSGAPDKEVVFFRTQGVCLALYPFDQLQKEVPAGEGPEQRGPAAITLAHNTRTQKEVDQILAQAEAAGGRLVKPAQPTFWGGYSGYFADPDGYLWEIAYADFWQFNQDGSLLIE